MTNWVDKFNMFTGAVIGLLSMLFGEHWLLFAAFLCFNVCDWLTGWAKARKQQKESSAVGWQGAKKKAFYWVLVAVSFLSSVVLMEVGAVIGLDLSFLQMIGWFVLASLLVNEIRSILENLVELGVGVPEIIIKGLAVTQKLMEANSKKTE